ncbi:MAG: UDP-N-acetylmuramate dehydrogenase [Erysipelotrichaceae bacterium]|nr:UDP-N-acetylmuramate dehydrogenase [Erysipelotrichaceae bacterium]
MIKNFIKKHNLEYYEDISLKRYNTYRIDSKCKYLIFPKNKEELKELLQYLSTTEEKYIILGNGSNIILKENYYNGVVILLTKLNKLTITDNTIEVEAGYSLQKLALESCSIGLTGLEFACGIPGHIGASIAMNAGAYNSSLSEIVETVEVINPNFEFVNMTKQDLDFEYRSSMFKKNKNYIIVSAVLKLEKGNKEEILEKISKRRVKRIETQPLDMPSAGSVFRNPPNMHAGELIEKCGLKGYNINGAEVSEKHANFIVNTKNATGRDIIKLIEKVKQEVKKEFNIDLILEQIIVD